MPSNLTGSNSTALSPDAHYNFPALIFGIFLIIFIICGNLLVCISVYKEKALKTTTNYFIVSLAVADLLLAVLVLPLFVYAEFQDGVWSLNMTVCDALMTMDVMLCTASIFNLCAISVDRFIAVSIPFNYNRKHVDQRQIGLLVGTWVLALAVASPVIFGINNVPDRSQRECKLENESYVLYSSVCSFFIPCPLMLLLYYGIFRGLRRWEEARKAKLRGSMQASQGLLKAADALTPPLGPPGSHNEHKLMELSLDELVQDPEPQPVRDSVASRSEPVAAVTYPNVSQNQRYGRTRAKINRRERKAMRVLPVVVGAFMMCWTPFFVVHTLRAMCNTCEIPSALMSTVTWLGYVNSAVNPVIYTVFNTEFRKFFKKFLPRCYCRGN
ncbi:dopamine receptor D4a [Alosa sapidissima]|uniref:dopamine receptor D4a n=1 Tax=Alosa sapidissima TaxID=34773 RepID=UPI001C092C34|nr:dopamine receptor D4a [Alosa sapidissima]